MKTKHERLTPEMIDTPTIHALKVHPSARLPTRATDGSVGFDVYATHAAHLVAGNEPASVGIGIALEIPPGFEAQVRPRSSLGRAGVIIPNAPGTIDSDYRGEICVLLAYVGRGVFTVSPGDRVAQLVFQRVPRVNLAETIDELGPTERGAGGFGSTGR